MSIDGGKERTISIWFKPYLQSHWGSAPNHHSWDPGLYWMGTTDNRFNPKVMDGGYAVFHRAPSPVITTTKE